MKQDSRAANLSARIKQWAADLGFSVCRITTANPPEHQDQFESWLDSGLAGEMNYLHRQRAKRAKPTEVLANAQSFVCLAVNYAIGDGHTADEVTQSGGIVARYARYNDYHHDVWAKLNILAAQMDSAAPGTVSKGYCDTGPITERDLAMRAGIGWIGKHTNLISRDLGNWFFLAEIITDIELAPDVPESTHCGTCTRCIPACPTGAITAPYTLDARRCISYLTIELKGSIPEDMRPLIGSRIYGCDDCLAVCPWNKFAVAANDSILKKSKAVENRELVLLLELDDAGFKARFSNSPILRTKRRGFIRNVCVAAGNMQLEAALPQLNHLVRNDREDLIKEHANWAINKITGHLLD